MITATSLTLALWIGVSLIVGMVTREYARAWAATRLGDPTPRLWGRLSADPRGWFDPLGSGIVPGLILVLFAAAASFLPPPVAYGKPAPVDPAYLRRHPRDVILVSLAGPLVNLTLGVAAGLVLRGTGGGLAVIAFEFTNLCLCIFHLLPIPGLDGARMLALALPTDAARLYRNADRYLPLFVLGVVFLLAGVLQGIVYSLVNAICTTVSGFGCTP
jgi:Zn-dependent protease